MVRRTVRTGLTALAVGAAAVAAPAGAGASTKQATVPGSVAQVAVTRAGTGVVAGSRPQTIQVWLAGDEAAAQAFVDGVSTPGSSSFHRYLSPKAYTRRFGASVQSAQAVRSWLASQGMSDVTVSAGRDYVSATASTATVDRAFKTQMRSYAITSARGPQTTIQSNDRTLSVPAALASDILSITGLNSTPPTSETVDAPRTTSTTPCSHYWAQHTATVSPAFDGFTRGATPLCGYSADQLRAAYGQTMANDGRGVTIAFPELGEPYEMGRALADFAHANRLPAPAPGQFRQRQLGTKTNACGNPGASEEALDSESAYAMAPGAHQLMVEGSWCVTGDPRQSIFDAELAPLIGNGKRPSASIESASTELGGGEDSPPSELRTDHSILLRAAAEGVGMYFATGDSQTVGAPADDPDATAVGGTSIGVGARNRVLFQTGWSDLMGELVNGAWTNETLSGGGGGASSLYDEPAYQKGVVPASLSDVGGRTARTIPDISADGDANTGLLVGMLAPTASGTPGPYTTTLGGGTSMATPLVAGMVADAQQGQPRSFGFINPLLYSLSGTRAITDVLAPSSSEPQTDRDVYSSSSVFGPPVDTVFGYPPPANTDEVIAPGYDTVTGLGTPDGQAFISTLRARSRAGRHP